MALYEFKTRIRYTETDSEMNLTPMAMLDLFQNCSTFQSEDLGVGVEYLWENHKAWVLSSWQMCIDRMPHLGDEVTVQTWSYGIKRSLGFRNFRILGADGERLCYASSLWVYIDTDTFEPAVCPAEEVALYGTDSKLDMNYASRKLSLPASFTDGEHFEVKSYFLDTNHHMNNGKFILCAMEYLPEGFQTHEIRTEYKESAMLGDIIYSHYAVEEGIEETLGSGAPAKRRVTVSQTNENGDVYATIQFFE